MKLPFIIDRSVNMSLGEQMFKGLKKAIVKGFYKPEQMLPGIHEMAQSARGVYMVSDYPASEYDPYAVAVESVGSEAMICGESVLGMLMLTDTNPTWIHVGTSKRKRRNLSDGIKVETLARDEEPEYYEGVRCQSVEHAIRSCVGRIMPERLREAVDNSCRNGYLTKDEARKLKREIAR